MEVMIAFLLIIFCLVPLMYPNFVIYKEQLKMNQKIELDHTVTLLYGDLLEQLHKRTIPYEMITSKELVQIPISYATAGIDEKKFPFTGTLQARRIRQKGQKKGSYIVALVELTYSFIKKNSADKPITFTYKIPLVKLKPQSEQSEP